MKSKTHLSLVTLIKNSSFIFILNIVSAAVGFFSIPITIKIIGIDSYGELILIQAIYLTIFTIFSMQYWQGLLIELPGKDICSALLKRKVVRSFQYELVAMTAVVIVAMILSAIDIERARHFNWIDLLLLSISVVLQATGTFTAYFRLVNKYTILMLIGCGSGIAKLLALYYIYFLSPSLSGIILVYAGTDVLSFLITIIFLYFDKSALIGSGDAKKINENSIIKTGKWSTLQSIADLPVAQLDKVIIGFTLPGANLGLFNIFKKIYAIINMATAPFYITSIPEFSSYINTHDLKGAFILWKKTTTVLFALVLVLASACFATKTLWMNYIFPGLTNYTLEILIVLASAVIAGTFVTTQSFYWALGNVRESTVITVTTIAIYLLILFPLCFSYGITGAVTAFLLHAIFVVSIKTYLVISAKRSHK